MIDSRMPIALRIRQQPSIDLGNIGLRLVKLCSSRQLVISDALPLRSEDVRTSGKFLTTINNGFTNNAGHRNPLMKLKTPAKFRINSTFMVTSTEISAISRMNTLLLTGSPSHRLTADTEPDQPARGCSRDAAFRALCPSPRDARCRKSDGPGGGAPSRT